MSKTINVVFVCLGNICRSPMAEAVFQHIVDERGLSDQFHIESAGTAHWHIGERPHIGTQQILKKYRVPLRASKTGQQVQSDIFERFDYVVAMDSSNQSDLKQYGNAILLLEDVPGIDILDVPDPYFDNNFDKVYHLVLAGCNHLLDRICKEKDMAC